MNSEGGRRVVLSLQNRYGYCCLVKSKQPQMMESQGLGSKPKTAVWERSICALMILMLITSALSLLWLADTPTIQLPSWYFYLAASKFPKLAFYHKLLSPCSPAPKAGPSWVFPSPVNPTAIRLVTQARNLEDSLNTSSFLIPHNIICAQRYPFFCFRWPLPAPPPSSLTWKTVAVSL